MFSDIAQHWASQCIIALAKREIIRGYPNGTFRPEAVVSRAEFAALMQRVFPQLPVKGAPISFRDVTAEYWASEAIRWGSERALFSGDESGRFSPKQTISRVQAIVVLMAGLSAEQASEAISEPEQRQAQELLIQGVGQTFSDAKDIPDYGWDAVGRAISASLLEPLPEPRPFRPNQSMTRGEVAGLLCRVLDIPAGELVRDLPGLSQTRQSLFQGLLQAEQGFNAEELAFLDRKIVRSPYRKDIKQAAYRLQVPDGIPLPPTDPAMQGAASYPARGERPFMDAGGLDFLSSNILSGCACLSTVENGELKARWLGREAFVNRQMWSSTKFIPLLNLIDRANGQAPYADIDQCLVRRVGGQGGFPFNSLASGIMSYDNRIATSNSLAAMFKHFNTPAGLEKWTREMTGNGRLSFQGRYGEIPFIQHPELWDTQSRRVLLKSPMQEHRGQNLVSTYDLTRLITMAGWHWRLPKSAILSNVQTHSLESVLRAMGVDTARYVDVAIERLGLEGEVKAPVIVSKSGFGRSDQRDRTELTYSALVQFALPRSGVTDPTASHQHYSFGLTLIAAQRTGDGNQEARFVDALMATEVTEIVKRLVTGQL
ncbi:MAG: S-layer homology domain-containing protein [Cyanobacteria bacterium P01_C01_bin.121]